MGRRPAAPWSVSLGLVMALLLVWGPACSSHTASDGTTGANAGSGGAGPSGLGQGGHAVVAEILESASTNSRSMHVDIYADASADRTIGRPTRIESDTDGGLTSLDGTPKSFPPGSAAVVAFLEALVAVNDLAAIPTREGSCRKSTSFGTRTTVRANGQTSGDLQCIDSQSDAGEVDSGGALYAACTTLERSN